MCVLPETMRLSRQNVENIDVKMQTLVSQLGHNWPGGTWGNGRSTVKCQVKVFPGLSHSPKVSECQSPPKAPLLIQRSPSRGQRLLPYSPTLTCLFIPRSPFFAALSALPHFFWISYSSATLKSPATALALPQTSNKPDLVASRFIAIILLFLLADITTSR